jgi:hypothetical protein
VPGGCCSPQSFEMSGENTEKFLRMSRLLK